MQAIEQLAKGVPKHGTIVEVGTFLGRSTWCWCKSVDPTVQVIGIDRFDWLPEYGAYLMEGERYNSKLGAEEIFDRNTSDCTNLKKIVSSSLSVVLTPSTADIVFIDANHHFPNVALDIGYFLAFVKSGGIISGDDYSDEYVDVKLSVDSLAGQLGRKVELVGSKLWFIRL